MNVAELRKMLDGMDDDLPVMVNAESSQMILTKHVKRIVVGEAFMMCGW